MIKIATLLTLLTAATAVHADLTQELRCREIDFSRSAEARDAEAFASFIDADARFVGDAVMRGPAEIAAAWAPFFESGGPTIVWRPRFVEVLEDGRLALTRGPYRTAVRDDDGNLKEAWGTFNSVWRLNRDGQWRVVFDAGSPSHQAPPDAVAALLDSGDDCP